MTSICSCGWFLSQKEWALSYLPNNNTPKLSFRSENGFFFFLFVLIPCLYFLRCWHSVIASLFVVADTPVVYQCLWIVICLINGMALPSGKCPSVYQSFFALQHPLGLCFPLLLSVHKCRTFFRCLRASCFHHRYLFFWRSQGHGLQDLGKKNVCSYYCCDEATTTFGILFSRFLLTCTSFTGTQVLMCSLL